MEKKVILTDRYDILKVFSTILVVVAHITKFYSYEGGVFEVPSNPILDYITNFIYSFHMPLFIFLSGAIFCECIRRGKYDNFVSFVNNKFKRLMIPYFVWGLFYVAPVMVCLKITDLTYVQYVVQGIFCELNSRHLWFLWVLFFCFVIIRFLKPIMCKGLKAQGVILFLSLGMAIVSPYFPGIFGINHVMYYVFYFVLGYLFHQKQVKIDKFLQGKWYLSILLFVMVVFGVKYIYLVSSVLVALIGIIFCYSVVANMGTGIVQTRIYKGIQKNSFGIYLFYPMMIYVVFYLFKEVNPYIFCIIVFGVVFFGSYIMTELFRVLKLGWIFGEVR